jgi:TPR repeat protein
LNKLRHTVARAAVVAVALGLAVQVSLADDYRQFPGAPTDSRTLRIQERVEGVFSSGDYARALLIYEKELAPLGDKYAQYMVGFMHLNGKGVEADPAEALAWYRLAAERGEESFIKARDALHGTLGPGELERSDERFATIWQRYSDRKLILDLISRDLAFLRRGSGSAIGVDADTTISIVAGYAGNETSDSYYRRVRERLTERLRYLRSTQDAEEAGIDDPEVMEALEAEVRQELKAMDLP